MDEAATQQFLQGEAQRAAEELGVTTPNEQPQSTETPAPEAPAPEAPVETPAETPEAPAPAEVTPAPVEEEDDYPEIPTFVPYPSQQEQPQQPSQPVQPPVPQQTQTQIPQTQQPAPLPALDPSQFTDQYGNVDVAKFTQAIRQRDEQLVNQVTTNITSRLAGDLGNVQTRIMQEARQEATRQIMAAETEKRGWERTFAKYPQVRDNKELRDQIHKMRLGEVAVTGKPVSPMKIADRFFSHISAARNDGVKQATQTIKVQETAHLETAANTASDKGLKTQQSWDNVGSRNRQTSERARTDILKSWLADGTLQTK